LKIQTLIYLLLVEHNSNMVSKHGSSVLSQNVKFYENQSRGSRLFDADRQGDGAKKRGEANFRFL